MKSVTLCLLTEELFYNVRRKKPFQRVVVAALLCWNPFFVILELSDMSSKQKGKSVKDFEHYCLYFINLALPLSGEFFFFFLSLKKKNPATVNLW